MYNWSSKGQKRGKEKENIWRNNGKISKFDESYKSTDQNCFSSVQFSRSVVSDSLRPHESQHARFPCPSPTPGVHPDSRPLSQWCHPAISSSVVPFSSCPPIPPSIRVFSNEAWLGEFWVLLYYQTQIKTTLTHRLIYWLKMIDKMKIFKAIR